MVYAVIVFFIPGPGTKTHSHSYYVKWMFYGGAYVIAAMLNFIFMFSYVTGSSSFPKPMSAEEERRYLEEYGKGSEEARNILIERNLRLVAHIAKKYSGSGRDNEDLISVGTIGLIKGISTFDTGRNIRLATYAARCIENAMLTLKTMIFEEQSGLRVIMYI